MGKTTVTWHAGAMDTPDNSIESIEEAVRVDSDIIEIDVTSRRDGTPVIAHREWDEDNDAVLFEDALNTAKPGRCLLNLDIKNPAHIDRIVETVKKTGMMDRVFYTGIEERFIPAVKGGEIKYYLNYNAGKDKENDVFLSALCDKIKELGAIGLNSCYDGLTPYTVRFVQSKGLLVSAWTVNDAETARCLFEAGVDNITSRRPDIVKEAIK